MGCELLHQELQILRLAELNAGALLLLDVETLHEGIDTFWRKS